jgi:hypothetical protein
MKGLKKKLEALSTDAEYLAEVARQEARDLEVAMNYAHRKAAKSTLRFPHRNEVPK